MHADSRRQARTVDVIIRTLADNGRESSLERAIESVHSIDAVKAHPIVVVNGDRYDAALVEALRLREDLTFVYMPEPSAGKAMILGRSHVAAPYFMYLDDDDELIPQAIDSLLNSHLSPPDSSDWDVLISNRLCETDRELTLEYSDLANARAEPMQMLLKENWLSAGASIFATQAVDRKVLDVGRDHHEWTHIAFRLAYRGYRLKFVDVATAIYHDTELSLSKSQKHHEQELGMLKALAAEPSVDSKTRALVVRKYCNLLHIMAVRSLRLGSYKQAWHYHLASMRPPHTFRYLLFSRKLVLPLPRRSDLEEG